MINKSSPPPIAGVYLLGFIGSAVHFVGNSEGFGELILAILKALVWPAFLINRVFDLLNI
ncbi:hypothetical protein H0X09_03645 [Candidatus Saccharibacteria bacterium]|nr:hypothetical protein [Candidatus Saccharibacteria bacterium]